MFKRSKRNETPANSDEELRAKINAKLAKHADGGSTNAVFSCGEEVPKDGLQVKIFESGTFEQNMDYLSTLLEQRHRSSTIMSGRDDALFKKGHS